MRPILLATSILLVLALLGTIPCAAAPQKVLLTDVSALTFKRGKKTAAQRSSPIPQLQCIGGPCHKVDIPAVQCRNVGDAGGGDLGVVRLNRGNGVPAHARTRRIMRF